MTAAEAMVLRPGVLTPCCDRVPAPATAGRWLCRGCGTLYVPARAVVEAAFGRCTDVTPMTPRRLRAVGHALVWVDD